MGLWGGGVVIRIRLGGYLLVAALIMQFVTYSILNIRKSMRFVAIIDFLYFRSLTRTDTGQIKSPLLNIARAIKKTLVFAYDKNPKTN